MYYPTNKISLIVQKYFLENRYHPTIKISVILEKYFLENKVCAPYKKSEMEKWGGGMNEESVSD